LKERNATDPTVDCNFPGAAVALAHPTGGEPSAAAPGRVGTRTQVWLSSLPGFGGFRATLLPRFSGRCLYSSRRPPPTHPRPDVALTMIERTRRATESRGHCVMEKKDRTVGNIPPRRPHNLEQAMIKRCPGPGRIPNQRSACRR
jgi:hypothetical protein